MTGASLGMLGSATADVPAHVPMLLAIGFAIFFGTVGARLFQKVRIPQVVGYIVIGLILGRSGFDLIDSVTIDALTPFNYFALGLIGFMIGGELHREVFRKYGGQFLTILLSQGIGAFVLVSLLVGAVAMIFTRDVRLSAALGMIFGAIASATAPAATASVLWECKARGPLTTMVFAIIALDDGLALVLYSLAASAAAAIIGLGDGGLLAILGRALRELAGGALLGAVAGLVLNFVLRRAGARENSLTFTIGAVALVVGAGRWLGVDVILASMALGMTLTNFAQRRSNEAFRIVQRFAPPIYVLFFVVVGAQLHVQGMPLWVWALAPAYLVARTAAKIVGANLGARWAGATATVRKYLGLCLFSQGGVAVGLSIMAAARFPSEIGTPVIMVIALTTLVVELIAPPCVKIAIKRAREDGLDVTEDDLARSSRAGEVMDRTAPTFSEGARLADILRTIAETSATSYAVTDPKGDLLGVITLQDLKQSFSAEGLTEWLLATDLMRPPVDTITEQTTLIEAMTRMGEQDLESIPVVAGEDDRRLLGLLGRPAGGRWLSQELLRRQRLADGGAGPADA